MLLSRLPSSGCLSWKASCSVRSLSNFRQISRLDLNLCFIFLSFCLPSPPVGLGTLLRMVQPRDRSHPASDHDFSLAVNDLMSEILSFPGTEVFVLEVCCTRFQGNVLGFRVCLSTYLSRYVFGRCVWTLGMTCFSGHFFSRRSDR